jgi:hypothetical protein
MGEKMPEVKLSDIEGFRAWANIVINNIDTWEVPEENTQVDIYNNDETAYLVINVYTSATTVKEYTFITEKEEDKSSRLILLFDFLKSIDFSLTKLLQWLENAPFSDSETGDCVLSHGLAIYLSNLTDAGQNSY